MATNWPGAFWYKRGDRKMKITYYGYNAFVIQSNGRKIFLDPGMNLHWRKLDSLIPEKLWEHADLILVTHGDVDHAEDVLRIARASGAQIVCGEALANRWQRKGQDVVPLAIGGSIDLAGLKIKGVPARHGPMLQLFGKSINLKPWFVGVGATGLLFTLEECRLLNLGDTVMLEREWLGLNPHVLMVPIGGLMTMDVEDALKAVQLIEPEIVIPVHHNWDILFYHRPTDVERFTSLLHGSGRRCIPLKVGESVVL
jgi:L-ascorbate metabolism protein UlaG (beta-lactamase superfamily)